MINIKNDYFKINKNVKNPRVENECTNFLVTFTEFLRLWKSTYVVLS